MIRIGGGWVMKLWKTFKFKMDERGFTGLEAAIVLIAFVVVASVFSYVILNAGFSTTQKSQEVIHTGVEKAAQSIELAGDVIGIGNTTHKVLYQINFTLQCTAGATPVNVSEIVFTYTDEDDYVAAIPKDNISYSWLAGDKDTLLEPYEKVEFSILLGSYNNSTKNFTSSIIDTLPGPNDWFQIEVKPPGGAVLPIKRMVPPEIDKVMILH